MPSNREKLVGQVLAETRAMASHALGIGIPVPPWVLSAVSRLEASRDASAEGYLEAPTVALRELSRVHQELVKCVAPAKPQLLVMLYRGTDATRFRKLFGQVRIVRSFMFAAMISIGLFVATSLSEYINDPRYGHMFGSEGWPLLINELFYLSSAAMGASFSNLFHVNKEITNGTYLPRNEFTYWVQFILGIVSGFLMSTILDIKTLTPDNAVAGRVEFVGALLALLGGFSSSIVQKVIQRLLDAMEAILRGNADQEVQIREEAGRLKMQEALAKERMRTTLFFNDIQRRLAAGEPPESLLAALEKSSQSVLANEAEPPPPALAPPPAAAPPPPGPAPPPAPLAAALELRAIVEAEDGAPLGDVAYEIHHEGRVIATGRSTAKGEIVQAVDAAGDHEILIFGESAAKAATATSLPVPDDVVARHSLAAFHAARLELARGVEMHGQGKLWETKGSNRGPLVDDYIKPFMNPASAPPWCGMFVGATYLKAGFKTSGKLPATQTTDGRPVARKTMFMSAVRLMLYFKGAGCPRVELPTKKTAAKFKSREACAAWLDEHLKSFAPQAGDILLCHTVSGDYTHVGMVASYDPQTYELVTYEGNYGNRASAWRWDLADPSDMGFFRVNMIGRLKPEDFEAPGEVPPEGPSPDPVVEKGGAASAR